METRGIETKTLALSKTKGDSSISTSTRTRTRIRTRARKTQNDSSLAKRTGAMNRELVKWAESHRLELKTSKGRLVSNGHAVRRDGGRSHVGHRSHPSIAYSGPLDVPPGLAAVIKPRLQPSIRLRLHHHLSLALAHDSLSLHTLKASGLV